MNTPDEKSVAVVVQGCGGMPKIELSAPDGARAEVYLHGAHITAWVPASGRERLFLSRISQFFPGEPIRGGVPVCFPQFGGLGPLPLHGLARLMSWEFEGARLAGERATAVLRLYDTPESRVLWPHSFQCELAVSAGGQQLEIALTVTNSDGEDFDFTTSFHTYLAVSDLRGVCVEGLEGLRYRDAAAGGVEKIEEAERVSFGGEVNRIYFDAPAEARLIDPGGTLRICKTGFPDTVVWNPAAEKCIEMADLEPEDYQRFVCLEAAVVGEPVHLEPGASWQGAQRLEV